MAPLLAAALLGLALPHAVRLSAARPRAPAVRACAELTGDSRLVAAMEALKGSELERAGELVREARRLYEEKEELTSERVELLGMIEARLGEAEARKAPKEASGIQSLQAKAVASKLAAKLGPVTWTPRTGTKEEDEALREGDSAVSTAVTLLGEKDFAGAYDALDAARDAFRRAGSDVEEARAQTLENIYGYIRAEIERDDKLKKLIRMKQILKKKKALQLQDELEQRSEGL